MRNILKNSYEIHSGRNMGVDHHAYICVRPFMTKSAFVADVKRKMVMAEDNGYMVANVLYHGKPITII